MRQVVTHLCIHTAVQIDPHIHIRRHVHTHTGAGKSIYVKSLSLIAVLAQIGCFVPAESASLPIFDRILTSLGTGDDMVGCLSLSAWECGAFVMEAPASYP